MQNSFPHFMPFYQRQEIKSDFSVTRDVHVNIWLLKQRNSRKHTAKRGSLRYQDTQAAGEKLITFSSESGLLQRKGRVENTFHISIPYNNETLYPGVIIYEIKTCLKNRKMCFRRSLVFHVFPNNSKEMLLNTVTVINTSLRYTLH